MNVLLLFNPPESVSTDLRERRRARRGWGRETLMWERNTDGLPPVHTPPGDRTLNLLVPGPMLRPPGPPGQGWISLFIPNAFLSMFSIYDKNVLSLFFLMPQVSFNSLDWNVLIINKYECKGTLKMKETTKKQIWVHIHEAPRIGKFPETENRIEVSDRTRAELRGAGV